MPDKPFPIDLPEELNMLDNNQGNECIKHRKTFIEKFFEDKKIEIEKAKKIILDSYDNVDDSVYYKDIDDISVLEDYIYCLLKKYRTCVVGFLLGVKDNKDKDIEEDIIQIKYMSKEKHGLELLNKKETKEIELYKEGKGYKIENKYTIYDLKKNLKILVVQSQEDSELIKCKLVDLVNNIDKLIGEIEINKEKLENIDTEEKRESLQKEILAEQPCYNILFGSGSPISYKEDRKQIEISLDIAKYINNSQKFVINNSFWKFVIDNSLWKGISQKYVSEFEKVKKFFSEEKNNEKCGREINKLLEVIALEMQHEVDNKVSVNNSFYAFVKNKFSNILSCINVLNFSKNKYLEECYDAKHKSDELRIDEMPLSGDLEDHS